MPHFRILFLLIPLLLVSCTNFCQQIADYGAEYEGVAITEPGSYYKHEGRMFIKGQRVLLRRTYTDHPFAIAKPLPSQFEKKEGSLGEIVYHEITFDKGTNGPEIHWWGKWLPLNLSNASSYPLKEEITPDFRVFHSSRKLTPQALYAYPLAGATLVCVDVPLNVSAVVLAVPAVAVCGIYGGLIEPLFSQNTDKGEE